LQVILLLLAGLVGGLVRGYSGFGFALAAVPLLNLGFPPAIAVPSVLIVECGVGLFTVAAERRHIDRAILFRLGVGTLLGTPLGVLFLSLAPADLTRLSVALVALAAVAVLWRRPHLPWMGHEVALFAGGFFSGLLNGGTAMSGPPAVLVLLGAPLADRAARAILMAFILGSAGLAVLVTGMSGLQGPQTLTNAATMAPGVIAGALLGVELFRRLPQRLYRTGSFAVLFTVSVLTVVTTLWVLTAGALA
jgi:uncharacterized membrane protein YfcA